MEILILYQAPLISRPYSKIFLLKFCFLKLFVLCAFFNSKQKGIVKILRTQARVGCINSLLAWVQMNEEMSFHHLEEVFCSKLSCHA